VASAPSQVVEVRVELKPGIVDAEAESVAKSLALLGIGPIASVHTAKVFRLEFPGVGPEQAHALARDAVDRLLANPVIHRVTIHPVPA
jgi:phosphoribosylformylglycinamidine synthase PurS subunit